MRSFLSLFPSKNICILFYDSFDFIFPPFLFKRSLCVCVCVSARAVRLIIDSARLCVERILGLPELTGKFHPAETERSDSDFFSFSPLLPCARRRTHLVRGETDGRLLLHSAPPLPSKGWRCALCVVLSI